MEPAGIRTWNVSMSPANAQLDPLRSFILLYALMYPMGNMLISMGEMWFSWLVNLIYAVLFAVVALVLVPRYGAVGYAASVVIAYGLGSLPCVAFLYRRFPDVMRSLRWGLLSVAVVFLFALCVIAFQILPSHWAVAVGVVAAVGFLVLKFCVHVAAA